MSQGRVVKISVGLCFFLSGATGLAYEIVWMRMLGLVFGHTVFAVTTVLAGFMAGLALGAWLIGKVIDRRGRPLQVYGLLEMAVAVYAIALPFLLVRAQALYVWLYRGLDFSFPALTAAQFGSAFLLLVVPTSLMGATLPVVTRFFARDVSSLGRKVADLYAVNTLGAVAGSVTAGFFLLPAIGVTSTTALAAMVNAAIGLYALWLDRRTRGTAQAEPARAVELPRTEGIVGPRLPLVHALVIAGAGLSGAAAMVYEVTWTRALTLVIGSSIYAFSAMLTTFLAGLALGSFLFARLWGRRATGPVLFASLEIAIGLVGLALIAAVARTPDLVLEIMRRMPPSPGAALLSQFLVSFLVMIVPTALMGAALPCAIRICAGRLDRLGRDVGRVYSLNTAGTLAGALLAGFVLVPALGLQPTMIVAAAVNAAVGVVILVVSAGSAAGWPRVATVPVVLAFATGVLVLPRWSPQTMAAGVSIYVKRYAGAADATSRFRGDVASRELLFYRDGVNATVSVERTERMTSLRVDGKVDASNGADMPTQLMLGHLPVLLHPRPERVLVIGLGSGVTVGAIAQHPVVRAIDVVELEPAVAQASEFFASENRGALHDPRVRLVIGDGRNFILASPRRYDVITSEPSNPWMAGVANLFSRDFYELARARLADNGIMVQWFHGYSLFPRELKMIAATFRRVFPHTTLWSTIRGDYLLVGTRSPLTVDYALLERRLAASATARADLESLHLDGPVDLLTLFLLDEMAVTRLAEGAPENSDDRPRLEFAAPLALYANTTDDNHRLLQEMRHAEFPPLANVPAGLLTARLLHFARADWARGERAEALDRLARAPAPSPEDIGGRLERAKLRFALGDVREAAAEMALVAARRPDDRLIRSYLRAGAVLSGLGMGEALAEHSRTSFGLPNPAEAHNNLGVFFTRLGIRFGEVAFFDLAVDSLEAARRMEPQSLPVLNNLANAYFELGRLDDAVSSYQQVIAVLPRAAEPRYNLGLVYERQGKADLARREFQAAARFKPGWALPQSALARVLIGNSATPGAAPGATTGRTR